MCVSDITKSRNSKQNFVLNAHTVSISSLNLFVVSCYLMIQFSIDVQRFKSFSPFVGYSESSLDVISCMEYDFCKIILTNSPNLISSNGFFFIFFCFCFEENQPSIECKIPTQLLLLQHTQLFQYQIREFLVKKVADCCCCTDIFEFSYITFT